MHVCMYVSISLKLFIPKTLVARPTAPPGLSAQEHHGPLPQWLQSTRVGLLIIYIHIYIFIFISISISVFMYIYIYIWWGYLPHNWSAVPVSGNIHNHIIPSYIAGYPQLGEKTTNPKPFVRWGWSLSVRQGMIKKNSDLRQETKVSPFNYENYEAESLRGAQNKFRNHSIHSMDLVRKMSQIQSYGCLKIRGKELNIS